MIDTKIKLASKFDNHIISGAFKNIMIFPQQISSREEEKNIIPNMFLINKNPIFNHSCTCTKTKCLKKYCECLSNNQFCNMSCNCLDCHNVALYKNNLEEIESVTCTCLKSNCNKKYCECYKVGEKCNNNCRCINCLNINKNKYIMESISILIENKEIKINTKLINDNINNNTKSNQENKKKSNFYIINSKYSNQNILMKKRQRDFNVI